MDNDRDLRTAVVSALDAVAPPAPWLASDVAGSLRERSRRGGRKMVAVARVTGRGLSVAVAFALVLLLGATAVGIFALRSLTHPVPAHPSQDVVRYVEMLKRDHQVLNQAAGREVVVGGNGGQCNSLAQTGCPAFLGRAVSAYQVLVDDLGRTTPPAQFAAEDARMREDLPAEIIELNLAAAAFNAGDSVTMNRALDAGAVGRDELLRLEAYVVYQSSGGHPSRDAGSAAYAAMIAHDYDNLHLPTLISSLLTCKLTDAACAPSVATTRSATQVFLADLRAGKPPAGFATIHTGLVSGLEDELQSLDQVDAAYASRDETALDLAKQRAINAHGRISAYAGGILYAH